MRALRRTLIVGFIFCLPLPNLAQNQSQDSLKIIDLEKRWTDAYRGRNIGILSSLLDEDFIITVEDGSTYGKMGYISHSADKSVEINLAEQTEMKVRIHGSTAIATGAYHEKGTAKGVPYEYRDRLTDVWMKGSKGWVVIASHYSVPIKP
jgi:ketosteroid isomerase-like protein